MPLTETQRAAIRDEAARRGIDEGQLLAAAERTTQPANPGESAPGAEQPKLFMYLLPFVTVAEVRQKWLGLTDRFAGDSSVASDWAAKHGASNSGADTASPDNAPNGAANE